MIEKGLSVKSFFRTLDTCTKKERFLKGRDQCEIFTSFKHQARTRMIKLKVLSNYRHPSSVVTIPIKKAKRIVFAKVL